jgi:ATP-dependent DNA helicase PIF1
MDTHWLIVTTELAGKSYVVHVIELLLATLATKTGGKYFPVAKSAPSASAAFLINGCTVDTMYSISFWSKKDVTETQLLTLRDNFKNVKLVLIDEISMLKVSNLKRINRTLKKIACNDLPWGGYHIILCGDFYQLPCIPSKEALYIQDFDRVDFNEMRMQLNMFERYIVLTEVVRQKDKNFAAILSKLRHDPISNTVGDCIYEEERLRSNPSYVPSVFTFPSALAQLNKR